MHLTISIAYDILILVFVDAVFRPSIEKMMMGDFFVSILVLLDAVLQLYLQLNTMTQLVYYGFNPCFAGSCFATSSDGSCKKRKPSFNPCFAGSCFATML
jgi:hypothetical protein